MWNLLSFIPIPLQRYQQLVRANYSNIQYGIKETTEYLADHASGHASYYASHHQINNSF